MNEPPNPARVKIPPPHFCECGDPGCPVCHGNCRRAASVTVYRSDMDDETGTSVCDRCAEDCLESGVFYTKESAGHIVTDLLLREELDGKNAIDAVKLIPAIRLEMERGLPYEKAKKRVLANVGSNPNHYTEGEQLKAGHVRGYFGRPGHFYWEYAGRRLPRTDFQAGTRVHGKKIDLHTGQVEDDPTSIEPLKEPPGSAADLQMKGKSKPRPKGAFYPSQGGASVV